MADCKRSTRKKYAKRPSPPYPAQACKDQELEGNDGHPYKSLPNKKGIYTWRRSQNRPKNRGFLGSLWNRMIGPKSYKIHFNGSRPFTVTDHSTSATVTKEGESEPFLKIPYKNLWIGDPKSEKYGDYEPGSSILLQRPNGKLVLISRESIDEFSIKGDTQVTFMNPIGNSDVPEPFLVGTRFIYDLSQYPPVAFPADKIDLTKETFSQFRQINEFKNSKLQGHPLTARSLLE